MEGRESLIPWAWFSLESSILLKEVFCNEYQQASNSHLLLWLGGHVSNKLNMKSENKPQICVQIWILRSINQVASDILGLTV